MADTVVSVPLDTEVWFRIEMSYKGDNDWCVMDSRTWDSMILAKSAMDRHIAQVQDTDEKEYRLVRVTTRTEHVQYT